MTDATGSPLEGAALEHARRRVQWTLVAGAALGSTAVVSASTVGVIAARDMLDDAALVGASGASITLGVAVGTSLLAALMVRRGRRPGLALGNAISAIGALIAVWAVSTATFVALLAGTFLIGFANSSSSLSRYASAELATPARRGAAISLVVWALTVGAIAGPVLVPVAASFAESIRLPELAGPFLVAGLVTTIGMVLLWLFLRPDPDEIAVPDAVVPDASRPSGVAGVAGVAGDPAAGESMRHILLRPPVMVALIAMVIGQVVMVTIMAMTPLHMADHGHDLGAVGIVISAHMLGMFALSPLSGRIADRVGALATIMASMATLAVAAILSAVAPPAGGIILLVALFLLGYGWNLGFVAGSALLTSGLRKHERTRTQGFVDSLVWGSSAVASLAGGFILAATGFAALGLVGALLLIVPTWAILALRGRLADSMRPAES